MLKGNVLSEDILAAYVGDDVVAKMYVGDIIAWQPIDAVVFDAYYTPDPGDF